MNLFPWLSKRLFSLQTWHSLKSTKLSRRRSQRRSRRRELRYNCSLQSAKRGRYSRSRYSKTSHRSSWSSPTRRRMLVWLRRSKRSLNEEVKEAKCCIQSSFARTASVTSRIAYFWEP